MPARLRDNSSSLGRRLGLREAIHQLLPHPESFRPPPQVTLIKTTPLFHDQRQDIVKITVASRFQFHDNEILRPCHPDPLPLQHFHAAPRYRLPIVEVARAQQVDRNASSAQAHPMLPQQGIVLGPSGVHRETATIQGGQQTGEFPLPQQDEAIDVLGRPACAPRRNRQGADQTVSDPLSEETRQERMEGVGKGHVPSGRHLPRSPRTPEPCPPANVIKLGQIAIDPVLDRLKGRSWKLRSHVGLQLTPAPLGQAERQREAGRWRNSLLPHGIDSTESRGIGQGNRTILTARLRKPLWGQSTISKQMALRETTIGRRQSLTA